MTNQNQIVGVRLFLKEGTWTVEVTKEFAEEYGGGSQVFQESGGTHVHRALDVAREMVTVSPGRRTDTGGSHPVPDYSGRPE